MITKQRLPGGAMGWCPVLVILLIVLAQPASAVNLRETPLLAAQIGYRLERELGPRRASVTHLLAWRLHSALIAREFAAGDLIQERAQGWENTLQRLEAGRDQPLPAWFAPIEMGTIEPLLLGHLMQRDSAAWHPLQQAAAAAALGRLVTSDLVPEWATHQYPALQSWARDHAPMIWQSLLSALAENPDWVPLVAPVFAGRLALDLDAPLADWLALDDQAGLELEALEQPKAGSTLQLLQRQADLLQSEDLLADRRSSPDLYLAPYQLYRRADRPSALDFAVLALSRALANVERGQFAELVQVLAGLVEIGLVEPSTVADQRLTGVLEILRNADDLVLTQMAKVDPSLSDTYLRLRQLLGDGLQRDPAQRPEALSELASLRAAGDRHTTDLQGYLQQPARAGANEDLQICMDISQSQGQYPMEPITREQFSRCLSGFAGWGLELARSAELAGRGSGPFEPGNLSRELGLNQWQRINYWIGYVDNRYSAGCGPFDETLVNPLEWALAANAYAWFAERWPAYASANDELVEVDRLMSRGVSVLENLRRMDQCRRFGSSSGRSALRMIMESYADAIDRTVAEMGNATAEFRARELRPEADIQLDADSSQSTNYRPESLRVSPCAGVSQCGMSQQLLPSRALLGLLPQAFLLADQARIGNLSACYDQVQWIDRRAEPSRVGNAAMARYYGRLSFDLKIYFSTLEGPIRDMRLTSQEEYEYLFGANSGEVLSNPCPIDLVGTQVVSQLPEKGFRLVPSRLTFLTAARTNPSAIFERHWESGDEWRDRFITGEGVELLASQSADPLLETVDSRLQGLYEGWNELIYQSLMGANGVDSLSNAMADVDREKKLLVNLARILEPNNTVQGPANRAALFGPAGLFDRDRAGGMSRQLLPANQIAPLALGFLQDARFLFGSSGQSTNAMQQAEPLVTNTLARLESLRYRFRPTSQN